MILNELKVCELENQNFIPEKIIQRKKEKKILEDWANGIYKDNILILSYEAGTGKTTTTKWLLKNYLDDYIKLYVLCRDTETNHRTLKAICQLLESQTGITLKKTRDHYDLILYIQEILNSGKKIVICLDEINYLIENEDNDNLICSLLHLKEQITAGNIIFILISNDFFIRKKFNYVTISRLGNTIIPFKSYAVGESADILKYYINEFGLMNKENIIYNDKELTNILISFIKKFNFGDMRRILKIFMLWASRCNDKLDLNKIDNDQFYDEIMKNELMENLITLSMEEQVILMSLIQSEACLIDENEISPSGKKTLKTDTFTGFKRFFAFYEDLSKKLKISPLAEKRFRFYVKELIEKKHLIYMAKIGFGKTRGVHGKYGLEETVENFYEDVIEDLCKKLGLKKEYIYGVDKY